MKSLWRLSSFVAFAVLLSCLPCALGQSATNIKATRAAQSVLNYAPPSLFAFAFTSGNDLYNNNGKGGKGGGTATAATATAATETVAMAAAAVTAIARRKNAQPFLRAERL